MNEQDYKPEYFAEIPETSESGDHGDTWYATSVLEFILSSYRYTCPQLYAACWKAYEDYCKERGFEPGEVSPRLGTFYNGWRYWFMGKYMSKPKEMARNFLEKLKAGRLEDELDFWDRYSARGPQRWEEGANV